VTSFVTSSVTVLPALQWEKLSVYDQIIIQKLKSRRYMISSKFLLQFLSKKTIYEWN